MSGEPAAEAQLHDFDHWLAKDTSKSYNYASLTNTGDADCPFKRLEARKYDWDDDNTISLRDNAIASSGALMIVPKPNHWVRIYVQANNVANLWDWLGQIGNGDLVDVSTSWGYLTGYTLESPQMISLGYHSEGIISADDDGYFECVLIGRANADPRDILAIDVDEDWDWSDQENDVNAMRLVLNGEGGSISQNLDSQVWVSLLDYGTCDNLNGAIIPRFNSMNKDVNYQGLRPNVPNGFYWNWETQEVLPIDDIFDSGGTDFGTDDDTSSADDDDGFDQVEDDYNEDEFNQDDFLPAKTGFEAMKDKIRDGDENIPFSTISLYGETSWPSPNTLRVENKDGFGKSGAALLEVRQGYYVKVNIMNEDPAFFTAIGVSLDLDNQLVSEDFSGRDSDFTITLYGGAIIWMDPDNDYPDAVSAFGGGFYVSTESAGYSISDPADNDYEVELLEWGIDDREPQYQCPEGQIWDPVQNMCVPIGNGGGSDITTDPFDEIDGIDTPFDEDDGLTDRLIKSIVFGINGSFRAVEAVVEGFVIALPALIVIGSAVVVANLAIKATETGAVKVVAAANKAKTSITTVKVEGIN